MLQDSEVYLSSVSEVTCTFKTINNSELKLIATYYIHLLLKNEFIYHLNVTKNKIKNKKLFFTIFFYIYFIFHHNLKVSHQCEYNTGVVCCLFRFESVELIEKSSEQ